MNMKRKIYSELLKWKSKGGKTALLIEGARRIGKSYIALEFARNEYESYILIDFSKTTAKVKNLFKNYLEDLDTFFELLQLYYATRLTTRKSLVIFDEIQAFPTARAAVKHLVADGRFDYIETGSLVSIRNNVRNIVIPSEEESITMHPMDFEEFLWAMGDEVMMPLIRKHFEAMKPMNEAHRTTMEMLRRYMIVGGMPQVVGRYVETRDFNAVDEEKRLIIKIYRDDIGKYAGKMKAKVTAIFDDIPAQLKNNERVFRLSAIKEKAKMRDYESAFLWLSEAGIINCCYNTTAPNIGLRMNMERSTLKCYMSDTGLLVSMAFDENGSVPTEVYEKILTGKLEVNLGMIVENLVAQMLTVAKHKLYFYHNPDRQDASSRMEIDFLIRKGNITSRHNIIPIEVKSSTGYTTKSLEKCADKFGEYVTQPTVLHCSDMKSERGIVYMPLYMTELLGH